jgi:2'-5' RNA ligase
MRVRGTGAFPTPRRPKTLWAGIADESGTLQSLHRQLEARLIDAIGYRPEERGYTPHLTLGRVKPQSDTTVLAAELGRLSEWDGGEVLVQELRIYRSELRREGPEYTVIGRGAFGE